MDLERFIGKCYEHHAHGSLNDFHRNYRRQMWFRAWRRAVNLQYGLVDYPDCTDRRHAARYRANWNAYCAADAKTGREA